MVLRLVPTPATAPKERVAFSSENALWQKQQAAECRAVAAVMDESDAKAARTHADELDAKADKLLGAGASGLPAHLEGEEASETAPSANPRADPLHGRPGLVAVDANRQRLGMTSRLGIAALAEDAAESVQARNSVEKMLAHQVAAAHAMSMDLLARASELQAEAVRMPFIRRALNAESVWLISASARLMDTAHRGALTISRLRAVGAHIKLVQQVQVNEGGQAVVAGQIRPDGEARRPADAA